MQPLPIDALKSDFASALASADVIVLEAPAGAGKTTRVPLWLLEAVEGLVYVAEPRRVAATLAARRVANELNVPLGDHVGYSVRFDDKTSAKTRLCFITDGLLARRMLSSDALANVGAIVLDEFHERSADVDLCLALALRSAGERSPKLVIMSATLDTDPLMAHLPGARRLRAEGRMFPLTIQHQTKPDDRSLERRVASAVRTCMHHDEGNVLVFVPGAREIKRSIETLERSLDGSDVDVLPLHGDLDLRAQVRAVDPGPRRKVVVSTNLAESSVTIDRVTSVVDTGLQRQVSVSALGATPEMVTRPISQASATQRAGRAGRTAPGRVVRLYTAGDLASRPPRDTPALLRSDLSDMLLRLAVAGLRFDQLRWLDPPADVAVESARNLLDMLGALRTGERLTERGRAMAELPLPPRLARMVEQAARDGHVDAGCAAAALLSGRDLLPSRSFAGASSDDVVAGPSDVLERLDRFREAAESRFDNRTLRRLGLNPGAAQTAARVHRQLSSKAAHFPQDNNEPDEDNAMLKAIAAGFIDRVARRRRPRSTALTLAGGDHAELVDTSVVKDAEWMVVVDASKVAGRVVARQVSAIDTDWLLDLCAEHLRDEETLTFDVGSETVRSVSRLLFGSLAVAESERRASPSAGASALLRKAAEQRGLDRFGGALVERLAARINLIAAHAQERGIAAIPREHLLQRTLEVACEGVTGMDELGDQALLDAAAALVSTSDLRALDELAPGHVTLPGGRKLRVHYEFGKGPWIASRLADFFGSNTGPTIVDGRVPLTLHLLAPNQRAVQVTQDLRGFWQRHYPDIRKELRRRYPKHPWPEDPLTAKPPAPRPPRRRPRR